jgi:hypothetical protein
MDKDSCFIRKKFHNLKADDTYYAQYHSAECRSAKCRGASKDFLHFVRRLFDEVVVAADGPSATNFSRVFERGVQGGVNLRKTSKLLRQGTLTELEGSVQRNSAY